MLSGSIAGALYVDVDRDGVVGAADVPGAGTVYLDLDGDAAMGATEPRTGSTGAFEFTGLATDTYAVRWLQTYPNVQYFPVNGGALGGVVVDGQRTDVGTFLYNRPPVQGPSEVTAVAVADEVAVELSWLMSPPENTFEVQRATGSAGGTFATVGLTARHARTFTDTTAAPDTTYRYRVRATYGTDASEWSPVATVTTPAPNASNPITRLPSLAPVTNAVAADPSAIVTAGGIGYFAATDPQNGRELWRTDGTESGTARVADLVVGTDSSYPQNLTNLNGTLLFTGNRSNTTLYRTDGTASGTVPLAQLSTDYSVAGAVTSVAVVGNHMYLTVSEPFGRHGLWRSDGTVAGTSRIYTTDGAGALTAFGNKLLFTARAVGGAFWQPFVSDGTTAGTGVLKEIATNESQAVPTNAAILNGRAYFGAGDGLWSTDGTAAGTTFVTNVPISDIQPSAFGRGLVVAGGLLYFAARSATSGVELWRSDGTAAGTAMLADLYAGPGGSSPRPIGAIGTKLVFTADWRETYQENVGGVVGTYERDIQSLWATDGTATGTVQLTRVSPNYKLWGVEYLPSATIVNGTLYFSKKLEDGTGELWKSNLTPTGTVKVASLGKAPFNLSSFDGRCTFAGEDTQSKAQLWSSDGTAAGTAMVRMIGVKPMPARPDRLTNVNGTVFFTASDGLGNLWNDWINDGHELWKSDGTAAGTARLYSGGAADLAPAGGRLVFRSYTPATGWELWTSDGTAAGTKPLIDLRAGTASSDPRLLGVLGSFAFYRVNAEQGGGAVYRTDGTTAGTTLVLANCGGINEGTSIVPAGAASHGSFYFAANVAGGNGRLYRVGTTGPATAVAGFEGFQYSAPGSLTDVGGTLYFVGRDASDMTTAGGPWKVTGPAASVTRLSTNFNGRSLAGGLTAVGTRLFFVTGQSGAVVDPSIVSSQLWVTDGTSAGTRAVADLPSSDDASVPMAAAAFDGALHFLWRPTLAYGAGAMLYRSDGTAAGTKVLMGGLSNGSGYVNQFFMNVAGSMLFINDGPHLIKSDGTATGTGRVSRITDPYGYGLAAGAAALTVGNGMFYSAERPDGSRELRVIAGSPPAAPTAASVVGSTPTPQLSLAPASGGAVVRWSDVAVNEVGYRVERTSATDPQGPAQQTFYLSADATSLLDPSGSATGSAYRIRAYNAAGTSTAVIAKPPTDATTSIVLQAEAAMLGGGTVANAANKGFTGSGYADFAGAGSSAQFVVNRTAAGAATLAIRYANGSTANRPFNVLVDGVTVGQLACPPTGGGSTWATLSLSPAVSLAAGANTVRLVAVGAGADLDQVTITPLTPPPPPADPALTLQGEAATLGGGTVANSANTGYTGSGYADFAGAGSSAQFTVTRPTAGGATLAIRYANGSTANRPYDVLVNGAKVGQLACPPTGGGSTWKTLSLASTVSLLAGSNTVRLVAVGAGADLDQLTVTASTTTNPPPPPPADPATLTLQGEAATLGGGTVASTVNGGYLGGGYADFAGAGSSAQFSVTRAAASKVTLTIRYSNGSTANRPFDVIVNGTKVGQLACPPTGAGHAWATLSLADVSLLAGSNAIRFVAVGYGANLDQLTVATA